jgi:HAD superfamily hydrolase (TIGR01662 family)
VANFPVVLFDLGNTLLYFDGLLHELVLQADQRLFETLVALGCPLEAVFIPVFRAHLRAYFNQRDIDLLEITVEQILRQTLVEVGCPDVSSAHLKTALRAMYAVTQVHWNLENETLPVLAELHQRGCRLGLISNAADAEDAHWLLEHNDLAHWFEQVLISSEVGFRKPHLRIFQLALEHFRVPPEQVVMVGDTLGADVLGAQQAGLASVWLTRRAKRGDNLAHENTIRPDRTIESLSALPDLLDHWAE